MSSLLKSHIVWTILTAAISIASPGIDPTWLDRVYVHVYTIISNQVVTSLYALQYTVILAVCVIVDIDILI